MLVEDEDGEFKKIFLFGRILAALKAALHCVTGPFLATGPGSKFEASENGGKEMLQYCIRHINGTINQNVHLTREFGSVWERLMLAQGANDKIAELFLKVLESFNEHNLQQCCNLGAEKALYNLSRYSTQNSTKQRATVMLTKLTVQTTPNLARSVPKGRN